MLFDLLRAGVEIPTVQPMSSCVAEFRGKFRGALLTDFQFDCDTSSRVATGINVDRHRCVYTIVLSIVDRGRDVMTDAAIATLADTFWYAQARAEADS